MLEVMHLATGIDKIEIQVGKLDDTHFGILCNPLKAYHIVISRY